MLCRRYVVKNVHYSDVAYRIYSVTAINGSVWNAKFSSSKYHYILHIGLVLCQRLVIQIVHIRYPAYRPRTVTAVNGSVWNVKMQKVPSSLAPLARIITYTVFHWS